jgi:hypothetical protein
MIFGNIFPPKLEGGRGSWEGVPRAALVPEKTLVTISAFFRNWSFCSTQFKPSSVTIKGVNININNILLVFFRC